MAHEPVDLNKATREELLSVMGLGPRTVDQILEYREKNGPFGSVDELENLPIVTRNELEKIRPHFKV